MGVQGLWQLLSSVGKPVPLESLDGKILAVDVSVWLHQLSKGMRDSNGNPLPNAHLQGLFSRICKLLYYRIKPVFVFDGGIQTLKKFTLASRRSKREDAERSSRLMQQKILTNLIRSQALEEAYGIEGRLYLPPAPKNLSKGNSDAMFHLPPIPESSEVLLLQKSMEDDCELQQHLEDEHVDIGSIDVESEDFRALPLHIQHEVITDIKQRRKDHTHSRIVELPADSKDFSNFQMAKLVKHNKLNIRLDELRKELNQKQTKALSKYYGDLSNVEEISSQRIVSDDAAHYILVKRNLQKDKELSKNNKEVSKKKKRTRE